MSTRWALCVLAVAVAVCAHDNSTNEDINDVKNNPAAGRYYGVSNAYYPPYGPPQYNYEAPFDYKPLYDTHYCSVHGSFALTFSDVAPGDYNAENQGYAPPPTKRNRKYIREYCRFSAAQSDKACHFCCQVVARSAYTNKDDIISAIFAFDPANPTAGGAGAPISDDSYGHQPGYGAPPPPGNYGPPPPQPGYGQGPPPPAGYGSAPPPPQQYGAPYRQKRDAEAAPPSTAPDSYPVEPEHPAPAGSTVYKPINQCVCCAPKYK
ncbi:unnamed protein product [Bursaphelenchus okinawaensis]|uniref:Uncharacterized protein n=1 Tax=Bursaphelenchus okinawaensis TaxID=465554 RepID=A0A811KWP8_9BILA|nr:unnamed protein product [Bursaphelenchus okinawaensis]CAG9113401.1 unnamed protein product [Bursaphelenchus okinawaensis]